MTHNATGLFAGVGESNRPGSVFIYKISVSEDKSREFPPLKMDWAGEVQAHSSAIERMRLSYDNNQLFSVGKDGCIIIYDVKDKDPKGKQKIRETLAFSEEILTEKSEID